MRSARVLEVPPVLSDVRDTLAQLLHQVVEKMETASYDKGLLLICKVYDMVLNYRGISANDFKWKKQFYRMGKVKYRSIASFQLEKKTLPRRLLGTTDPQPPPPAIFNLAVVVFDLQSKRATSNIFAEKKRGCGMFRILKLTSSFWMTWLDYPCIHCPRYGVETAITTTKTQAVTFLTYKQLRQSAQRTLHTALRHLSKVRFSFLLQILREFVIYIPAVETRSCQSRHRDDNQ